MNAQPYIDAAHNRAEADFPDWGWAAASFLRAYAQTHVEFTAEEVTFASLEDQGFQQPEDLRAWGATFRQAIQQGVIEVAGTGRSVRRHSSICNRYRSRI